MVKVEQALIDPKWEWGKCNLGGEVEMVFVTLVHPAHGPITSLLPRSVARQMGAALVDLAADKKPE